MVLMIFFTALVYSNMSFAGPWSWVKDQGSWVKDKVSSAWIATKRWRISRPYCVDSRIKMINGKTCELLRYDLSRDTDSMKNLRKAFHVSGIYWSDRSDASTCKMDSLFVSPFVEQYLENGFDEKLDNSVSACMYRLLSSRIENSPMKISATQDAAFMRLVWELEDCLPDGFNFDQDGREFIAFVRYMLGKAVAQSSDKVVIQPQPAISQSSRATKKRTAPASRSRRVAEKAKQSRNVTVEGKPFQFFFGQPQNSQQNQMPDLTGIVLQSMLEDSRTHVPGQKIEQYLLLWRQYSLRFRSNLREAIRTLRRAYGVE